MEQTNVRLRPFKLGDTEALTRWGTHDDPRFYQYNFPYCRSSDLERWYAAKKVFFKGGSMPLKSTTELLAISH